MLELNAATIKRRSSRARLLTTLVLLLFAGAVALEMSGPVEVPYVRPPFGSLTYWLPPLTLAALCCAVLAMFRPRRFLLPAGVFAVVGSLGDGGLVAPWAWQLAGMASVALFAWLLWAKRRGEAGILVDVPGPRPLASTHARVDMFWSLVALGASVLAAAGVLVAHGVMARDAADFEARAERVRAVVDRHVEDDQVVLSHDGHEWTFYASDLSNDKLPDGSTVPMLYDSADPDRSRAVAIPDDPSWLIPIAAILLAAGLGFAGHNVARRVQRERLLAVGGPASLARVVMTEDGDHVLVPTDGNAPTLSLMSLEGLVDAEALATDLTALEEREEARETDTDDAEQPELPDDTELAAWADAEVESADDELAGLREGDVRMLEAVNGPRLMAPETFTLVGNPVDGHSVALLRSTGQVWLAELRDEGRWASRTKAAKEALLITPDAVADTSADREDPPGDTISDRLYSRVAEAPPALRWTLNVAAAVAAVALAVLAVWLDEGIGIRSVIWMVFLSTVPLQLGVFWNHTIHRHRDGLVMLGALTDEVVARDRVEAVTPGRSAVAVRLRDPEDAIALAPQMAGEGLEPAAAAAVVEGWMRDAPASARSRRVISPTLVATIVSVLGIATVAAVTLAR